MNYSAPTSLRKHAIKARLVCASLFAFALLASSLAPSFRAQGSLTREEIFDLNPGGQVRITNARGSTRIESWDDQAVRVIAEKKTPTNAALEQGDLLLMSMQNTVVIECKAVTQQSRIDLTVYVPSRAQLQVTAGAFPVDVTGSLASAVIESTTGSIGYRTPASDNSRYVMNSSRGVVRSTVPLLDVQRAGLQSLQGRTGSGISPIILSSQSGSITLSAAPNIPRIAAVSDYRRSAAGANQSNGRQATDPGYQRESADPPDVRAGQSRSEDEEDASSIAVPPSQRSPRSQSSAVQPSSNNSITLGGSDQSDDDSTSYRSGPFSRPRHERTTTGGNAGLSVRIIPSNPGPATNRSQTTPIDGQTEEDPAEDQAQSRQTTRAPSSKSGGSTGNAPAPGNGSINLGGSDQSGDDSATYKSGPFSRPRHERTTTGGNAGLSVRIIPANPNNNGQTYSQPSEPQGDGDYDRDPNEQRSRGAQPPKYSSGGSQSGSRPSSSRSAEEVTQSEPIARATQPPALRRNSIGEETANAADGGNSPASADEDAIVLNASLVNLNVSVTNRSGVALANLKKEDFKVTENGDPQTIEMFAPTEAPFNLVLLVDLSGSITDKLDVIKAAALNFLKVIGPKDKVAIVTFTDQMRLVARLTSDRDFLRDRIKEIERPDGGTAFYEAVWYTLTDTLRGTRGQRNAIVVLSDGVDSSLDRRNPIYPRISFTQLLRVAEEADVTIFPIYLDTEYDEVFVRAQGTSEAYEIARTQLERLAEVTGGQYFQAEKAKDLTNVYKEVAAAIRTVYTIGYYSTNPTRDGKFRRVRVSTIRSDAAVRTRKGYYAK